MSRAADPFIAGVVEGFYGTPWSHSERLELFGWMAAWGLDTYMYAPKDDLHHRLVWREQYPAAEADQIAELIRACARMGLRFVYGIGPGLDVEYGSVRDRDCLRDRAAQLLTLGCDDFALLFDDVPGVLGEADRVRWEGLAPAQCHLADGFAVWLRERRPGARVLFCPTAYCSRMAGAGLGGAGYLESLGRNLLEDVDVLWTGPEIVSREISAGHVRDVRRVLRRKPLIWDNLHANDYDVRRFFCGPYSGRPPEMRDEVAGVLSNPNCELPLNYVPIRTLAAYLHASPLYHPRAAWIEAIAEWYGRFDTVGGRLALDDVTALGDCYYLPYESGPAAQDLLERLLALLARPAAAWGAEADAIQGNLRRLKSVCEHVAALRARPLFHALSRRVWELREELDLLDRFIDAQRTSAVPVRVWSDAHQPGTYRGGFVAALQRLLVQDEDGRFEAAAGRSSDGGEDPVGGPARA